MKRLWLAILLAVSIALCLPTLGTAGGEKARKRDGNDRKSDRPRGDRRPSDRDDRADRADRDDRNDRGDRGDRDAAPPATAPANDAGEEPQGSNERKRLMKDDRSQSEMAKEAMAQQKEIARRLAGNAGGGRPPPAGKPVAEQLATAQAELDAENYRHDARLRDLRRDERVASEAGNRKQLEKARQAIERANGEHATRVAELQQKIQDLRSRADAAGR